MAVIGVLLLLAVHSAAALVVAPLAPAQAVRPHSVAARTTPLQLKEDEISDGETALRWIGVQGAVDSSIILLFAYHYNFSWETAVNQPELKFLILMPAVTVFFQILRRFGDETGVSVRNGSFEEDPIVKFLGGAAKVRSLRNRWLDVVTVKAK